MTAADSTGTDTIGDAFANRVRFAVGRLYRRGRLVGENELSPGKMLALATVDRLGPIRIGDLAAREFVTAPTMTRLVQWFDDQGYVVRAPDPEDGRSCLVTLTRRGQAVLRKARAERTAMMSDLLDALSAEDRAKLEAALPVLEALGVEDGDRS